MPGGDGTGPRGLGPRTGRGLGYCNNIIPRFINSDIPERGFGRGGRYRRR